MLGSEAGVSADSLGGSSGTEGMKEVWDRGCTLLSEQKSNQVAVLETCTSESYFAYVPKVKNTMSTVIVESNMMHKDGTVQLSKLNFYISSLESAAIS